MQWARLAGSRAGTWKCIVKEERKRVGDGMGTKEPVTICSDHQKNEKKEKERSTSRLTGHRRRATESHRASFVLFRGNEASLSSRPLALVSSQKKKAPQYKNAPVAPPYLPVLPLALHCKLAEWSTGRQAKVLKDWGIWGHDPL